MSKLTLIHLPCEIIASIFEFLPYRSIQDLQQIPELQSYALQELYKSVKVHKNDRHVLREVSASFCIGLEDEVFRRPISVNLDRLVALIKDRRALFIKYLSFEDPRDLLCVHETFPNVMKNVQITVSFELLEMYSRGHDFAWLFQAFRKLPYEVTTVESFKHFNPNVYGDNSIWFDKFESIVINELTDAVKTITQAKFNSLTTLKCNSPIDIKTIELLPRTVKHIKCLVFRSESISSSKFAFPEDLISLEINYMVVSGLNGKFVADLTHLEKLQQLICDSGNNYKLPINLKLIKTFLPLSIKQVKSQCPELEVLQCCDLDNPGGLYELPSKLKELKLNIRVLDYLAKLNLIATQDYSDIHEQKVNDETNIVKFPKNLKKLTLEGNLTYQEAKDCFMIFSKTSENSLNHLTEFKISSYLNCKLLGPFPRFLKKLSIIDCKDVNFNDLDKLISLRYLYIQRTHCDYFEFKLPSDLFQMEMKDNNCTTFKIEAENLHCLILTGNQFKDLNDNTVQFPMHIKELDMSNNEIETVNSSFKFPKKLIQLSLSNNKLKAIPELPAMVEKFSCSKNCIGKNDQVFHFPTTLEVLDLNDNEFSGNIPFSRLNLTKCHRLRKLDLSYTTRPNEYQNQDQRETIIDLYDFPESLVSFSIQGCNMTKINGSFTNFPNLEEVDLRGNKAVGVMFNLIGFKKISSNWFFTETIKHVWITKQFFDTPVFEMFVKMLKSKPNFESLVVADEKLISGNKIQKYLNTIRVTGIGIKKSLGHLTDLQDITPSV